MTVELCRGSVMVNLTGQVGYLDRARYPDIRSNTHTLLQVSIKIFLDVINISINRL